MRYGRVVAFIRPTLQASIKYTTIDNKSIKFEQSVFIVLLIEHKNRRSRDSTWNRGKLSDSRSFCAASAPAGLIGT